MINLFMPYSASPNPRPNKEWATHLGSNLAEDNASPLASFCALSRCLKVIHEELSLGINMSQYVLKND